MDCVKIEERLLDRIGVREWGLPTLITPGKVWRSEKEVTMTCTVPSLDDPENKCSFETLPLVVIGVGELSILPDHWRDAMWEYVQKWPMSGFGLGPFLRISMDERNAFIRKMVPRLNDDIGCRHVAHAIGHFAAMEYELLDPTGT